jgi:hypothetical protein
MYVHYTVQVPSDGRDGERVPPMASFEIAGASALTLSQLRAWWPFEGDFHFRARMCGKDGQPYTWLDLTDDGAEVPLVEGAAIVRALPLFNIDVDHGDATAGEHGREEDDMPLGAFPLSPEQWQDVMAAHARKVAPTPLSLAAFPIVFDPAGATTQLDDGSLPGSGSGASDGGGRRQSDAAAPAAAAAAAAAEWAAAARTSVMGTLSAWAGALTGGGGDAAGTSSSPAPPPGSPAPPPPAPSPPPPAVPVAGAPSPPTATRPAAAPAPAPAAGGGGGGGGTAEATLRPFADWGDDAHAAGGGSSGGAAAHKDGKGGSGGGHGHEGTGGLGESIALRGGGVGRGGGGGNAARAHV